eukprot:gnl/MRDRNA2_/MRDRNA2_102462_c0_seq1.p1 gnl/MRDRNA2_/MRDRNA2_102462_c0~~gnl/MRDRNA2_/MRDRNA2_102462_c0_seq1.p1  ORF type:complete len:337 (-),score=55.11 gnl/MRDRNA2_/MRDRNA2_102462_c0_seq1:98-1045(-)
MSVLRSWDADQICVRNTFIEVRDPTPPSTPSIMQSKTCPCISSNLCDGFESALTMSEAFASIASHDQRGVADVSCNSCDGLESAVTMSETSSSTASQDQRGDSDHDSANETGHVAVSQIRVWNTFIEFRPYEPASPPVRSRTCPAVVASSWDDQAWDDAEVPQENEPNIKSSQLQDPRILPSKAQRPKRWVELILQPRQHGLRADAKPFHPMHVTLSADAKPFDPDDVDPTLDMETQRIMTSADYTVEQEFMQQLHESLNGVCDWNLQTERKAAAPCLHVPCNTPASAFYSQDNSPCNSGATKRFTMVSNKDLSG